MKIESSIKALLTEVAKTGVREVCLCAGARNAALVFALEKASGLKLHSFFEERSAAFFALGRSLESQTPVAVLTTSGTAVAELLPAAVEAYYQKLPLLLITADRPKHFRNSGAPQAIEQVGIFSQYVLWQSDLEIVTDENKSLAKSVLSPSLSAWNKAGPAHLNVCLPDPTGVNNFADWVWPVEETKSYQHQGGFGGNFEASYGDNDDGNVVERETSAHEKIDQFLNLARRPLVIVSGLSIEWVSSIENSLAKSPWLIYAEGPSGLRESRLLKEQQLCSGDAWVLKALKSGEFDSVIRIGSVPTLRAWRDLDEDLVSIPILNFSEQGWSGLGREQAKALPLSMVSYLAERVLLKSVEFSYSENLLQNDRQAADCLLALFDKFPEAEASWFHRLSKLIRDTVYVGNSMPIREWDLAAQRQNPLRVIGNRGANGIDGQLSTFFGLKTQWGVFGDLTALYDLPSPWALSYSLSPKNIVIINNGGGDIFRRKFSSPQFINSHRIHFQKWAEMWGLSYLCFGKAFDQSKGPSCLEYSQLDQLEKVISEAAEDRVIEILPDPKQSQLFWQAYGDLHR